MKIKITAPGIYNAKGEEIAVGTEMTVKAEPTGWAGRYTVLSDGLSDEDKVAITNPAEKPSGVLEAKDQGGGWWAVVDTDGKEWGKKLRKDDAEAFNGLSDEDKVAFVTEG